MSADWDFLDCWGANWMTHKLRVYSSNWITNGSTLLFSLYTTFTKNLIATAVHCWLQGEYPWGLKPCRWLTNHSTMFIGNSWHNYQVAIIVWPWKLQLLTIINTIIVWFGNMYFSSPAMVWSASFMFVYGDSLWPNLGTGLYLISLRQETVT